MYSRILCPIDGSETSNLGLAEAIMLAKDQSASLYLLHIVDIYFPMPNFTGEFNYNEISEMMNRHGQDLLEDSKQRAEKQRVSVVTKLVPPLRGTIYQNTLDYAKEIKADLIVIGTHGLRGFKRLVLGSDAEAIVRESPVPVLLVKNHDEAVIHSHLVA